MQKLLVLFIFFLLSSAVASETVDPEEYRSQIIQAYEEKDWHDVVYLAKILARRFPSEATPILFHQGVAYYELRNYGKANKAFSEYLEKHTQVRNFEEVLQYKLSIAEFYRLGTKKQLFSWSIMPNIVAAKDDALEIYEEIITSLPHHDLAARALYGKALVVAYYEDYKESVETFQLLIRRFPKHELASQSFVEVARIYLQQLVRADHDPDLLDLSKVNLRKFTEMFPSDPKIEIAKAVHGEMEENFAKALFEIASFYERTGKKGAAAVYYKKINSQFPASFVADQAEKRFRMIDEQLIKKRAV